MLESYAINFLNVLGEKQAVQSFSSNVKENSSLRKVTIAYTFEQLLIVANSRTNPIIYLLVPVHIDFQASS